MAEAEAAAVAALAVAAEVAAVATAIPAALVAVSAAGVGGGDGWPPRRDATPLAFQRREEGSTTVVAGAAVLVGRTRAAVAAALEGRARRTLREHAT